MEALGIYHKYFNYLISIKISFVINKYTDENDIL